jgi:AraC-like DNA-binding protein
LSKAPEIIYTTNAGWVSAIYDTLQAAKIDTAQLFNRFGIPLEVRNDPELRVDVTKIKQLWKHVVATTGDDAISLQVTRHVQSSGAALLILGSASENLRDALDKMTKYLSTATTGVSVSTHITDTFSIELEPTPTGVYIGDEAVDALMAHIAHLISKVSRSAIKPLHIELKRPKPKCLDTFENVFGCPLSFNQNHNTLVFSLEAATRPFKSHDSSLAIHMEQYLADQIEKQLPADTANPLVVSVLKHVNHILPEGKPSIGTTAKHLNMSDRTLQRKLKENGFSFQELLNTARINLSYQYLKQGKHNIEAISDLLGFSSYTSFIRFFRVNTGLTPKEFIKLNSQ